ncbi:MAG: response regulator transcription factor [Thermoleophilia bacterium]|nr:response regulator transcription factor [Thermoleophilia bacterium]
MIAVVIVEDNDVFREALEILLALTPDVEVLASVPDGEAAVAACRELRPAVAVVDYRLPGADGVATTRAIREVSPASAVVVLTAAADEPVLAALERAGAAACLLKDRALDEIVAAIRDAAR